VRWKAALALTTIEAPEYNGHPTTTIPQDAQSNGATTAHSSLRKFKVSDSRIWHEPGQGPPHTRGQTMIFLPAPKAQPASKGARS
jgi:hypothetical protein